MKKALDRLEQLVENKRVMLAYMQNRIAEEDWHGVEDAGSDVRDIEAEMKGIWLVLGEKE